MSFRAVYYHGFASSPRSRKAALFGERLRERGHRLDVPDLNPPDFRDLTVGGMIETAERAARAGGEPVALIGSSLGGYLAAYLSARVPGVGAVILLAPAFDLRARWAERIGEEGLRLWRRLGSIPVYHPVREENVPLGWSFFEEGERYPPYGDIGPMPALLFHGSRDEVVPLAVAERFAAAHPNVELRVLDDEHDLAASSPAIVAKSIEFLERHVGEGGDLPKTLAERKA